MAPQIVRSVLHGTMITTHLTIYKIKDLIVTTRFSKNIK